MQEIDNGEMIPTVIVDDESLARESLEQVLEKYADIRVVARCSNGFEAVQAVHEFRPQLVFLDIQMPKLDGFDVVELLGKDVPLIVFVTAYDEYALKAFEADALDYILKPVQPQRMDKAIQRVRERFVSQQELPLDAFIEKHRDNMLPLDRILIRNGYEVIVVPAKDIEYIEAQDDYVKVYTKEGKSYLKSERMNRIEETLDQRQFCRIHRSYILNIDSLKKIEPYSKDSRIAILQSGKHLNISRSGYTKLLERL